MSVKSIEELFRGLRSQWAGERRDSAFALGTARADVIPRLVESLGGTQSPLVDGDGQVPTGSAYALTLHDPEIVTPLALEVLLHGQAFARRDAAVVLRGFGTAGRLAAPALRAALQDGNKAVRKEAAAALGCMVPGTVPEAVGYVRALCDALTNDSDPEVRREAAWAIGQIDRHQSSVDSLISAEKGTDIPLKLQATAALALVSGNDAPAVLELSKALSDERVIIRSTGALALASMGRHLNAAGQTAGIALQTALGDESTKVRRYAAMALGHWGYDAGWSIPELMKLTTAPEPEVRWQAVVAVARILTYPEWMDREDLALKYSGLVGGLACYAQRAETGLVNLLSDPEAVVRGNAAFALGRVVRLMGQLQPSGLTHLRAALKMESHPWVCLNMILTVSELELEADEQVAEALLSVARRNVENVILRKLALSALAAIGPGNMEHIPEALVLFLDDDEDSRRDLGEFLRKAGPDAAISMLNELWQRESQIRRLRAAAAAAKPTEDGLERMGAETVVLTSELREFLYIGDVFQRQGMNSLPYGEIERLVWDYHQVQLSQKTIRKRLDTLDPFFIDYFVRYRGAIRSSLAFVDRTQGRPPEILHDGWLAWEEVRRYFARLGVVLPDTPR